MATELGSLIGGLDPSAEVYRPQLRNRQEASDTPTLEELETMLAESIDRWNRELRGKRAARKGRPGCCFVSSA